MKWMELENVWASYNSEYVSCAIKIREFPSKMTHIQWCSLSLSLLCEKKKKPKEKSIELYMCDSSFSYAFATFTTFLRIQIVPESPIIHNHRNFPIKMRHKQKKYAKAYMRARNTSKKNTLKLSYKFTDWVTLSVFIDSIVLWIYTIGMQARKINFWFSRCFFLCAKAHFQY